MALEAMDYPGLLGITRIYVFANYLSNSPFPLLCHIQEYFLTGDFWGIDLKIPKPLSVVGMWRDLHKRQPEINHVMCREDLQPSRCQAIARHLEVCLLTQRDIGSPLHRHSLGREVGHPRSTRKLVHLLLVIKQLPNT